MARILVGCEESGVVRRAFCALGHDAYSNDLISPRDNSPKHLLMDVKKAILEYGPWDIIILHPECTALAVSGNSTYGVGMPKHQERINAKIWTSHLWELSCKEAKIGVCLENPVGVLWAHLGIKPQYIQPYQFGHLEQKKTGLALYNLPKLKETNNVYEEMIKLPRNKRERLHFLGPSPTRKRDRSETYSGIAFAMAEQWGNIS